MRIGPYGTRRTAEKYRNWACAYRHHHLQHQNDISLFEGVLAMLAELRAQPPAGSGHRKDRRG